MALKLVIKNSHRYVTNAQEKVVSQIYDIPLDNKELTAKLSFKIDNSFLSYTFSLQSLSFQKKMYQPTEVEASILIVPVGSSWSPIDKKEIDDMFKNKQVYLYDTTGVTVENGEEVIPDKNKVGLDFYVQDVHTCYKPKSMVVTLKIYSLDKLLTLRQVSRSFVAKKLGGDILNDELKKYIKPWTVTKAYRDKLDELFEKTKSSRAYHAVLFNLIESKGSSGTFITDTDLSIFPQEIKDNMDLINQCTTERGKQLPMTYTDYMQVLSYNDKKLEHIHPYLVQYNESFLDFLARTANRWGEFLYYEDGALNVGYNKSITPTELKGGYTDRYYFNIYDASNKNDLSMSVSKNGSYDVLASNEDQFIKNTLKKSPNELKLKGDKMVMKSLANFLKNENSIFTFLVNEGVDIALDVAGKAATNAILNNQFNSSYFPDSDTTHKAEQRNSDNDQFNQFTEIDTNYNDTKYSGILEKEQKTGENALHINFDATYPYLKLGQMITIDKVNYIVVEVSCKKMSSVDYALEEKTGTDEKGYTLKKTTTSKYVFEVVALADLSSDSSKVFYPAVIPSGHIRQADPQMATIADADDPSKKNQVRVKFPWQTSDDAATPWLKFTANAQGSASIGKHYKDDKVLVGFINGNVERPYVMGVLAQDGDTADIIHTTPGGHTLKINDDPAGVAKFMTGMFLPGWKTLSSFLPQMNQIKTDDEADSKLGGGFELSDNYGIYKISGSSDGRNVSVASPWGDVKINAFTGITISAPNGDVKITGKNVMIEAGNNLTLTSGSNVKKRLLADSATETFSNIGGNVAAAVAKKLLDTALNLVTVDLTIIRNVFDIVFRPIEGKLEIKSNRYLMLESGKGECVYPEGAFRNEEQRKKAILKRSQNDCRPGLNLASEVDVIAKKIDNIGDMIVNNWVETYNQCVLAKGKFEETVKRASYWANDNDGDPGKPLPVICKNYTDLDNDLWADSSDLLSDDGKLGFKDNFKIDGKDDVKGPLLTNYLRVNPRLKAAVPADVDKAKTEILEERKRQREKVFKAANDLRKNIIAFKKCCNGLSEDDIKAEIATINGMTVPDDFKKALIPAFKKENLGDTDFYGDITPIKDLPITADVAAFASETKALKRKAVVLWLENMGFKDEWRKAVPNRDTHGVPVRTHDDEGKPIPNTTAIPARVFNQADIANDIKWEDYLNSLTAVPKLSPVKWKVLDAMKKSANSYVDKLYFWKNMEENRSWNTKSGGILFSTDENTYKYVGNAADKETTIAKEKLSEIDDRDGVPTFLNQVRKSLKDIK